jgi:hypothetical protein
MKQKIVFDFLNKTKESSKLKRKLKFFAIFGIIVFFMSSALTIWAGVTAYNYIAVKATEVIRSPLALNHVENLKADFKTLPKFQAISCWSKAQSLLAVQPWLQRPALDNFVNLKAACLENNPRMINTTEGSMI